MIFLCIKIINNESYPNVQKSFIMNYSTGLFFLLFVFVANMVATHVVDV
jgi:hypothetical protein